MPVSNHKPRKGTETILFSAKFARIYDEFQITNPARGRKQDLRDRLRRSSEQFQITNPARGRKLRQLFRDSARLLCCFKSQTPQGDGNETVEECFGSLVAQFQITNPARGRKQMGKHCINQSDHHVSNHKPRKGTATPAPARRACRCRGRFKSQTPQGDGNLRLMTRVDLCARQVSNHKPRKGTETLGGLCCLAEI